MLCQIKHTQEETMSNDKSLHVYTPLMLEFEIFRCNAASITSYNDGVKLLCAISSPCSASTQDKVVSSSTSEAGQFQFNCPYCSLDAAFYWHQ